MDIIIIGSGMGGLATGVILAKNGHKVTVLEQHSRIGGCLQSFSRHGVTFETGMHFVGSALPHQNLGRVLRYLEIDDKIKLSPMDPKAYDVICINGQRYNYAMGREAFIAQMAEYFPQQKENLEAYYDVVEKVVAATTFNEMDENSGDPAVNLEYQMRSINEVVSSLITDPLLQDILVGILPLYAGEKDKTPFSTHAFIMDFYNKSAFRVVGGSSTVAKALRDTLERYGGTVRTSSKVTAIRCDDTQATCVVVNGTEELHADCYISDIHPQSALKLLDTKLIRPAFRNRIKGLENTASTFVVYVEFKDEAMPYMNSNYYCYRYGTPWDCEHYTPQTWPHAFLYMHMCHEDGARYARGGEIISYMWEDDVHQWAGTRVGRRGQDYEEFKRQKAEQLLDCVEKEFPGFRDKVKCYHTSTPLTYIDYTGTSGGSMYGIAKDIHKGMSCHLPHRTKVPNLLFTGQNINSHGMLGVLVGAIVTCSDLLSYNTIYDQIKQS